MPLAERLSEYVRACFTAIWIESHEHQDALAEIAELCRAESWRLASWNIHAGLNVAGLSGETEAGGLDPLVAIRALPALASPDGAALLVLQNFHRFLQSAEIVQALAEQIVAGKQTRTVVVVLSPVVQIPVELEKLFVVLEHELPGREQLEQIARGIATEVGELPAGSDLDVVLDAAAGLTRYEAENAFSLSLVRHGAIRPQAVWEQKTQTLKKSGLLRLYRGGETFADLGGLEALKRFCSHALHRSPDRHPEATPRGILLLSPPGCGKTSLALALGNETNRPTIILDVGSLMGGLVGATEQNTRRALATIDAMGSSVVLIDEVEKSLAGVQAGAHDSGVSARMFGTLLSWMSDGRRSDSFLVLTSNDVSKLPPEFLRSERLDATFFLDLPGREGRHLADVRPAVRARRRAAPARGRAVDRGRDPQLLPPLVTPGRAPGRCGAVRGAGCGHRGRERRKAAELGQRAVPVGGPPWPLRLRRPGREGPPPRQSRPVTELTPR